jgi:hypothetical protein
MAATVIVNEKNGAGETATDKTSGTVRFKVADNATVDLNDPITIPVAGSTISFEKIVRLNATGTFTQIDNVNFYMDGANSFGTGVGVLYKTEATFGTPIQPGDTTGFTDIFAATSGSPVTLNAGTVTGTGDFGEYLTMIMEVQSTAAQGTLTAETLTFSWDEI